MEWMNSLKRGSWMTGVAQKLPSDVPSNDLSAAPGPLFSCTWGRDLPAPLPSRSKRTLHSTTNEECSTCCLDTPLRC